MFKGEIVNKKELEYQVKTQSDYIKQLEESQASLHSENTHLYSEIDRLNEEFTELFIEYDTIKTALASIFDCDKEYFANFIVKLREEFRRDDE